MQKQIRALAARPDVARLLASWVEGASRVLEQAAHIQSIPAPTFQEGQRAQLIEARFREIGLSEIETDQLGNVYGRTPGTDLHRPALLISAHMDTVFPVSTPLALRYDESARQLFGPGIGDNSLGLAALLLLAEALPAHGITPECDIWWVATVGEEGLGDLRGMRQACDHLGDRIGLALILEGIGLGRIFYAGLGVRRLRVIVRGPGGHSWLHAGRPSTIHHLLRVGAALVDKVAPPKRPRSTLNIGLIEGGTSINTLAPEASLSIDLRSVESTALAHLEADVRSVVESLNHSPEIEVITEVVGDRPSASLALDHPLVRAAQGVLRHLNVGPGSREIGSTDANILLSRRVPAVCIGVTTGGDAHTVREFIDTIPVSAGMQQLTLLALLATAHSGEWSVWQGA